MAEPGRSALTEALMALCGQALGSDPAAAPQAASFTAMGGDSLLAMRLAARAERELCVDLPVGTLMSDRPLASVLGAARPLPEAAPAGARPASRPDLPILPQQHSMLLADDLVGGTAYHLVFTAHLRGALDQRALRSAVRAMVGRHEMLQSVFMADEHGNRHRQVAGAVAAARLVELPVADEADFDQFLRAVVAAEGRRPMDPARRPPIRWLLLTGPGDHSALVLVVHHVLVDGWAVGLLFEELFASYARFAAGREPDPGATATGAALLDRQRRLAESGELASQVEYWRATLAGVPSVLELPTDLARPATQQPGGVRLPFQLSAAETAGVRMLAARVGITPFTVFLATYGLVLSRYTGQLRLVVGVPVAGREIAALTGVVAPCFRTVPVVIDLTGDIDVAAYLRRVRDRLAGGIGNSDVPFHRLVQELAIPHDPSRNPLIQAVLAMHDGLLARELSAGGLHVAIEEGHAGGAPFDLTWFVQQADPVFAGTLEFATSVLSADEASAVLDSLRAALSGLATDVRRPLAEVRALSPRQLDRIGALRGRPPRSGALDRLLLDRIGARGNAIAVRAGEPPAETSYRELRHLVTVQAWRLREAGVRPGDRVLIDVPRSLAEIVAVLGTVVLGAAYVPIDTDLPSARLRAMIAACDGRVAIAGGRPADRFAKLGVHTIDPCTPDWAAVQVPEPAPVSADRERLAYVTFTSGTTGTPKAVAVPGRAVIRLAADPDYVRCGPGERFLRFAPLAFDASTLEIWAPVLGGATIEVHPPGLPAPGELGRFLRERGVTVLWMTAGLFRLVVDFCPEAFSGVRQVLTGGDVVSAEHVRVLCAAHPGIRVTNGYGPTENTTFTTVHHFDDAVLVDDPLPIGRPIAGTSAYVLDESARLVPPGAVGELYVAGAGLALGYLGDPEPTAEKFGTFCADLPDRLYRTGDLVRLDSAGRLCFLGRRDQQVKIRGHRVEPDEVRHVIVAHPQVRDAVVFADGTNSENRRLIAAVVPTQPAVLAGVRAAVAVTLPMHLRPAIWLEIDEIPLTGNGKVDLAALRATTAVSRPAQPLAARLPSDFAYQWARAALREVLGNDDFGAADDFFDLGGDSLRIARVVETLRTRHGVRIRLREFYATPTLNRLTALVEAAYRAGGVGQPAVEASDEIG